MGSYTTKTMNKKYLILIMARKGSDDVISRQNLRLVNNKPLLYYIVKTALKFKKADVIVSTDSPKIKKMAEIWIRFLIIAFFIAKPTMSDK